MLISELFQFDEQGGDSALIMAAERGRCECVSILIANGADVNAVNEVPSTDGWHVSRNYSQSYLVFLL